MTENKEGSKGGIDWNALIKYPAIAISAVIFMWLTELLVGIDFSAISKIGADGIEFEKRQEKNVEVASQFDDRISKLEGVLGLVKSDSSSKKLSYAVNTSEEAMENLATSSDAIAELSFKAIADENDKHTYLSDKEGFIWIGNEKGNKATRRILKNIDDSEIQEINYFQSLKEGDAYQVSNNMVLRAEQPTNDEDYFFNKGNSGVIPRGTKVILLEKPFAIKRTSIIQYWAKIKVAE
jgi:hypothetical protein